MATAYSCAITIHNLLEQPLTLESKPDQSPDVGLWQRAPPERVEPGHEGTFHSVGESSNGEWSLGTSGSVRYKVVLPACNGVEWLILLTFAISSEGRIFDAWLRFHFSPDQSIPCAFFTLEKTTSWTDSTLQAKLHVRYNRALTARSHATSVTIPASYVAPHICNKDGTTNSIDVDIDSNFVMWKADSLAEYEDNSDSFVSGSLHPVAVDVKDESVAMLDLHINIVDEMLLGVPLTVYGDNDIEKEVIKLVGYVCFPSTGERPVPLKVSPSWARNDVPWGVAGNIVWRFRVAETKQELGLNSSRLEFYALSRLLPSCFNNKVSVTLARRFILPRRTWPQHSSWERHCCYAAFYDFSFQYEIEKGRFSYGYRGADGSVIFRLHAYLRDIGKGGMPVNCYDQACMMFASLALSPIINSVEWIYMEPFGLIKTTVLIGRGACNNPFYRHETDKICNNPQAFGNHAFIRVGGANGTIVDACAGPHAGNETLQKYIHSSIDRRQGSIFGDSSHALPIKFGALEIK